MSSDNNINPALSAEEGGATIILGFHEISELISEGQIITANLFVRLFSILDWYPLSISTFPWRNNNIIIRSRNGRLS